MKLSEHGNLHHSLSIVREIKEHQYLASWT